MQCALDAKVHAYMTAIPRYVACSALRESRPFSGTANLGPLQFAAAVGIILAVVQRSGPKPRQYYSDPWVQWVQWQRVRQYPRRPRMDDGVPVWFITRDYYSYE